MSTNNQVAVIPQDFQLPDFLKTPDAAAALAAANAAAAGGIKVGGFPHISIKGGKFHLVEGDTTTLLTDPPAGPGAPATPKMLLRAVIVAANPALSKIYYEGEWIEGDNRAPDCSSDNGVTPDIHISAPQNKDCSTCPKNAWGSKISKASGKDVKACSDVKNLALIPAEDMAFKAVGLTVTPAALGEWGRYVKALSQKNIPVSAVITNIMFDHTASFPKLVFSFGGVLTAEQFAHVQSRIDGDDVKTIIAPTRTISLPAPAATQPAAQGPTPTGHVDPVVAASPQAAPAAAAPGIGFSATPLEPPAKRTRAARKPPEEAQQAAAQAAAATVAQVNGTAAAITTAVNQTVADPLAHLPANIRATIETVGKDSDAGKALLAMYPAPVVVVATPVTAPATSGFGSPGATSGGFGAPAGAPAASANGAASSLAEKLRAKLQGGAAHVQPT